MKIADMRISPMAVSDSPLLDASGRFPRGSARRRAAAAGLPRLKTAFLLDGAGFIRRLALVMVQAISVGWMPATLPAGEVLYNGIELPSPWPPRSPDHAIVQGERADEVVRESSLLLGADSSADRGAFWDCGFTLWGGKYDRAAQWMEIVHRLRRQAEGKTWGAFPNDRPWKQQYPSN
jgi:hypothetical protein